MRLCYAKNVSLEFRRKLYENVITHRAELRGNMLKKRIQIDVAEKKKSVQGYAQSSQDKKIMNIEISRRVV